MVVAPGACRAVRPRIGVILGDEQPEPTSSSLVRGPVAADSKHSLKESVSLKSNVTSSARPFLTLPHYILCLHVRSSARPGEPEPGCIYPSPPLDCELHVY